MTRSRLIAYAALCLIPKCGESLADNDYPAATVQSQLRPSASKSNAVSTPKTTAQTRRLEAILQEWETASSNRRRFEASFSQFKYDHTWQIEQRGAGSLGIDTDGRGYYEVTPVTVDHSEQSRRFSKGGIRYALRSAARDHWHFAATSIMRVNDVDRTFVEAVLPLKLRDALKLSWASGSLSERQPDGDDFHPDPPALPEDDGTWGSSISPDEKVRISEAPTAGTKKPTILKQAAGFVLGVAISAALWNTDFDAHVESDQLFPVARPFALKMSAAELKKQYHVKLLKEAASEAWLELKPTKSRAGERTILILSLDGYTPIAIKQFDPTGAELVHVFTNVRINPQDACFFNHFVRPSLKGYRPL